MPRSIDVAYTLHMRGDLEAAETVYRRMIADGETPMDAAGNLFVLLEGQGRWQEILELYGLVERWLPDRPHVAMNIAGRLLALGQYRVAWPWHEARRLLPNTQSPSPNFSFPEWRGERVERLLVWTEQGRGDEIMFSRFLAPLAAHGIDVTFMCRPELARTYERLPVRVVAAAAGAKAPAQDRWVLIGSLPLRLGIDLGALPPPTPIQGQATNPPRGRIGVVTKGSPTHPNDANRSLPADAAHELMSIPGAVSLAPEDTGARDFQDTADIVAGLAAVVTVDSAVAHLAGSMGKPTIVLLPAEKPDWRWLLQRSDSPWYPSVRLLRQGTPGDWRSVIAQVRTLVG